jgi:hypothetical protein
MCTLVSDVLDALELTGRTIIDEFAFGCIDSTFFPRVLLLVVVLYLLDLFLKRPAFGAIVH